MGIVFAGLCFSICGHEESTDQSSIAPPAPIIAPASNNHDRPETRNQIEQTKLSKQLSSIVLFCVIVFTGVTIPLHCLQETNPRSILVVDSFGPLGPAPALSPSDVYSGGNSTHWSNCFHIHAPADRWGFWHVWWEEHGKELDSILALV